MGRNCIGPAGLSRRSPLHSQTWVAILGHSACERPIFALHGVVVQQTRHGVCCAPRADVWQASRAVRWPASRVSTCRCSAFLLRRLWPLFLRSGVCRCRRQLAAAHVFRVRTWTTSCPTLDERRIEILVDGFHGAQLAMAVLRHDV